MTEDFKKTATPKGNIERTEVHGVIRALRQTVRTSLDPREIMNATLMLERLGQGIK